MTNAPVRACVIGWPVRHSRSPLVHGYWLRSLGLPGSYTHAEVEPERLAAFIEALPRNGFSGGNVTVPHKEAAFALCDVATATATALGAVNTLWFEDGKLHGDNTDVAGFLANLDEKAAGWDRNIETAVVLGAGGAARAVLHALHLRGVARCMVVNRTLGRAFDLRNRFGASQAPAVSVAGWDEWPSAARQADLIVNTTSLGMTGQPPLELELSGVPDRALVTDIVYVPLETRLLTMAKARGLRTVDGLGMLLHQAVPGFEHWFGTRPRVTPELRSLVAADIRRGTQMQESV